MSAINRTIRNIAIIAHVDHGKTTLVDQLLKQSGTFRENQKVDARVMDSNDLEKERGITILSKNCAVEYHGTHINIVDTPGHADFGGEVERVLSMVDSVLLLVDAVEGPMPQTRFVTKKALALGLNPIVVVNKVDRFGARPDWVVNATFELFDKLGANENQLDFPIIYASALSGYASLDSRAKTGNMSPLFEAILKYAPVRDDDVNGPLQLQIVSLDYSSFVGKIGIGRVSRGVIEPNQNVVVFDGLGSKPKNAKIKQVLNFKGLDRVIVKKAMAGDIVLINGIDELSIGSTVCSTDFFDPLPLLNVDEPTLNLNLMVNTSPLAGKEGKYVTSRQLKERLDRELKSNVALKVTPTNDDKVFSVSGRGELHLTILLENMRREGYELAVSKPKVIHKIIKNVKSEPFENLTVDIEEIHQGNIMEELGRRKGELLDINLDGKGRVRLDYKVSTKGLIGFQSEFLTITRGTGLMSHVFDRYFPIDESKNLIIGRKNGVLISSENGTAVGYSLWKLQERGKMFVSHNTPIYEGMIVGIHSRENDLVVNPTKGKQLTNVRASGTDEAVKLVTPIKLSLEYAIEFINEDELVEITPKSIRLRKRFLKEHERKKASRT